LRIGATIILERRQSMQTESTHIWALILENAVARVEQSEIRGGIEAAKSFPGFAALNPGYISS